MENRLPNSIAWNPKKIGYETPQVQWMQQPTMQAAIREARKKLIDQDILSSGALNSAVRPTAAHTPDPKDWRYFSLAQLFA
jgi:asparagine synthase (glutamine-hydrolysing)